MSERAARFNRLYAVNPDPWSLETSDYEQLKYAATLGALSRDRYRQGLEIGCSIGVFTNRLAARCDWLVAVDLSSVALRAAVARCVMPNVSFVRAEVPNYWPAGLFDLVMFSEVLYFLQKDEIEQCFKLATNNLAAGGEIVLVNWLGENDCALSGNVAAEVFSAMAVAHGMASRCVRRDPLYRIDLVSNIRRAVTDRRPAGRPPSRDS